MPHEWKLLLAFPDGTEWGRAFRLPRGTEHPPPLGIEMLPAPGSAALQAALGRESHILSFGFFRTRHPFPQMLHRYSHIPSAATYGRSCCY